MLQYKLLHCFMLCHCRARFINLFIYIHCVVYELISANFFSIRGWSQGSRPLRSWDWKFLCRQVKLFKLEQNLIDILLCGRTILLYVLFEFHVLTLVNLLCKRTCLLILRGTARLLKETRCHLGVRILLLADMWLVKVWWFHLLTLTLKEDNIIINSTV